MVELPIDVWYRIIVDGLQCNSKVLLSLALVSRLISELALDILWREQLSLRPFYAVINSYYLSRSPARLVLVEDGGVKDEWGEWFSEPSLALLEPLDHLVQCRVRSYLCRVRKLKVKPGCPWLSSMLPLLESCVKSDDPIFPNLTALHFSFSASSEVTTTQIQLLLPLLSYSLRSIDLHVPKSQPRAILTLLDLLNVLDCEIEQIRYTGPEHPEVFSALSSFTALRSLATCQNECANRNITVMSAIDFVSPLTSLRSLALDLAAFVLPKVQPSIPPINFLVLEDLRLDGTAQDLRDFLHQVGSTTVVKVTLAFHDHEPHSVPYAGCFKNLHSAFPDARELRLEFRGLQAATRLTYQHLIFIKKMPIQRFSLFQVSDVVPHRLTEDDICSLVRAWPGLTHFSLLSWSASYSADILIAFSDLQHLVHLEIYLNLKSMIASPTHVDWSGLKASSSFSPLQQLNLDEAVCLPEHGLEIYALLTHLRELFPRLRSVSSGDDASFVQERLDELECLWAQQSHP